MRTLLFAGILALTACKKEEVRADISKEPAPVAAAPKVDKPAAPPGEGRVIAMDVTTDGFVPDNVKLKANEPVTLQITRKTDETCATEILIDGTDINVPLPLFKTVAVNFTPARAGSVKFGCAMDKMVGGVLVVD
ncbi:MAG: copper transporter [Archangium gephyra]|uniref:Copper transporter n=1 Tax=Archangium gephyra TaxID=48 RepID=A0A2W5T769_9BACT|nr:MAG: copper transporter [Archangium gephyra]